MNTQTTLDEEFEEEKLSKAQNEASDAEESEQEHLAEVDGYNEGQD